MHLVCLCPTYGRPSLVANALALFLRQELWYSHSAHLLIYADDGLIPAQNGPPSSVLTWSVMTSADWVPLTKKYSPMIAHARATQPPIDAWVVWDDDDVYLPHHLQAHLIALGHAAWSHPSSAYSTYQTDPLTEPPREKHLSGHHYHGALAIRNDLMKRLDGWPITDRSDYDKQQLARCRKHAGPPANPCRWMPPSYVYRWNDTARDHASARIRDGRYRPPRKQEPPIDRLTPSLDPSTAALLRRLTPTR